MGKQKVKKPARDDEPKTGVRTIKTHKPKSKEPESIGFEQMQDALTGLYD